jgi:hypothetical protein
VKLFYIAIALLAAFVAIWIFVVAPAERRRHERKLAALQKQIRQKEALGEDESADSNSKHGQTGET